METYNFSTPTRQSVKGVFVVVLISLVTQLKRAIPLVVVFVLQWVRRPEIIQENAMVIGISITVVVIFLFVRSILTFKNFQFYIKDDQFYLHQGILKKSNISIPKSKIQNIHISQNLVQQLLNVVQVNIDSSGDKGSEVEIKALSREKANALRLMLLNEDKSEEVHSGIIDETSEEIIALNPLDLLLIGLTQNHLRNLLIVVVTLISFYKDIEDLLIGIGAEVNDKQVADLFNANTILGSLLLLLFSMLLGFLYSIVTIFIANFDFSIKKQGEALEIQKGLLNKNQFTIQLQKIQSVQYITNFLKSIFGLHTLRLYQTATADKTEKKNGLVGLRKSHLRRLEALIFGFNPLRLVQKNKPDSYYRMQLFFKGFLVLLGLNSYFFILGNSLFFYINVLAIPLVFVLVQLHWKKSYYHFDDSFFVVGAGGIDTVTSIAEIHNIQSVKFTQNIFQKRRNLVDLHLNTASNKFTIPCLDREEASKIYNVLLYKIESSSRPWQ
ncbi:PH domain-containing protein [Flavobacteriaceae bacterium F08102]|nr:PH domain-containing protein [Flavobacteriaceae bacterium F08102]